MQHKEYKIQKKCKNICGNEKKAVLLQAFSCLGLKKTPVGSV